MKKITSLIFAFLMISLAVPCFAAPSDIAATISQNNFVDIIVWIGIALFAIGILFILLSVYLGFKNKNQSDEDYDDYDDDIEIDDDANSETSEVPSEENADEPDSVEDNQDENDEASDGEVIDVPVEEAVKDTENDAVDESDDEPDEKSESEDSEAVIADSTEDTAEKDVKVTLSGLNNSDVKFAVFTDFATVGRRSENDIMIPDNAVSGTHCKFTYEDGKVYIEDLNSTNGTMLNDEVVSKSEISNGDTIIIGKCKYRISIYD